MRSLPRLFAVASRMRMTVWSSGVFGSDNGATLSAINRLSHRNAKHPTVKITASSTLLRRMPQ